MKDTIKYNYMVQRLRAFFLLKQFVEVPAQSRLSILAACEDPKTVSTFVFDGKSWPLPQTGQMWLESELLKNPTYKGVFCITTSYRNEPTPIEGRHDKIFPMFEFEAKGTKEDLITLEKELLEYMKIPVCNEIQDYNTTCAYYNTTEIGPEQEGAMCSGDDRALFITNFPESSDPFWNMKRNKDGTAEKVDVIIQGMETIGSAERETDVNIMRDRFHTISDGEYAGLLYRHFGKERVLAELEEYLALTMFPRFGGGIGLTRLARVCGGKNE